MFQDRGRRGGVGGALRYCFLPRVNINGDDCFWTGCCDWGTVKRDFLVIFLEKSIFNSVIVLLHTNSKLDIFLYETLAFLLPVPKASLLPIFPKQTLLQNSTLAIQVPIPMLSLLIRPSCTPYSRDRFENELALGDGVAGDGTISGLTPKAMAVPARPTSTERRKPGLDRSTRYQSTGLTRARVNETWEVDCQGSLR